MEHRRQPEQRRARTATASPYPAARCTMTSPVSRWPSYYHIELESHDGVFADNCPAETFMGERFRGLFQNAAKFAPLPRQRGPGGHVPAPPGWRISAAGHSAPPCVPCRRPGSGNPGRPARSRRQGRAGHPRGLGAGLRQSGGAGPPKSGPRNKFRACRAPCTTGAAGPAP